MRSGAAAILDTAPVSPRQEKTSIIIAPSILSADFARLGEEVRAFRTKATAAVTS
jgi:hypothetical protein